MKEIDPALLAVAKQRLLEQGSKLSALQTKIDAGVSPFGKDGWIHDWNELAESNERLKEDLDDVLSRALEPEEAAR